MLPVRHMALVCLTPLPGVHTPFPTKCLPAYINQVMHKHSSGHAHSISSKCSPVMHTALLCVTLLPVGHTTSSHVCLSCIHQVMHEDSPSMHTALLASVFPAIHTALVCHHFYQCCTQHFPQMFACHAYIKARIRESPSCTQHL
jgi:hypothetical protein